MYVINCNGLSVSRCTYGGLIMELYYIDETGRGLDEYGNEFRDEKGMVVYVPETEWAFYTMLQDNSEDYTK